MRPKAASRRRAKSQRGFTLIEVVVSMSIALFLLAGLFTIVQSSRKTFASQNALAQLQDTERLAMTLIADVIQSGGYYPNPALYTPALRLPISAPFIAVGQGVTGTTNAALPGDTITVRFATSSGDGILNCTGNTNSSGGLVTYVNVFSINAVTGDLQCVLNGAAAVPLVPGLTNMKIMYGVKTDFTVDDGAVDSYLTSSEMTAADWSNVAVVRITLTFTNPLAGQPGQALTIPLTRVVAVMAQTGVRT